MSDEQLQRIAREAAAKFCEKWPSGSARQSYLRDIILSALRQQQQIEQGLGTASVASVDFKPSEETGLAIRQFVKAILHGDHVHRAWLEEAGEAFIEGKALPAPRSLKPDWKQVQDALDDLSAELDLGFIIGNKGEKWECGQCGGKGADADCVKHEDGCIHPAWDRVIHALRAQSASLISSRSTESTASQEQQKLVVPEANHDSTAKEKDL